MHNTILLIITHLPTPKSTQVDEAGVEYRETFLPEIVRRIEAREKADLKKATLSMEKLKADMADASIKS